MMRGGLPSVPEVVPLTPGRTLDAAERERLIVEHLPLVRGLARRYADRGFALSRPSEAVQRVLELVDLTGEFVVVERPVP